MWLPKTEKEIIDAVTSRSLEESTTFDAKKELSGKNSEIAKDIAAMANDGGVIIYGIGEDDNKRLSILSPISLAGQAERIDAIVRSSIAEPPQIHISTIPTGKDNSIGYMVVFIPPSERAPHMVIVKGENRYYGRTATGNIPLSEGEVSRLYARREKIEVDRNKLLEEEIKSAPIEPNEDFAYLYLFSRPVFSKEGFFDAIQKDDKSYQTTFNELIIQACDEKFFNYHLFVPEFNPPSRWIQRVDSLLGQMGYDPSNPPESTLNLQIDYDGVNHLFCGRAGEAIDHRKPVFIFADIVAGLTTRFIAFNSMLYKLAGYFGMIDLGIAITGLKGSIVYTNDWHIQISRTPYDQDIYKKSGQFSNFELIEDPKKIAKYLVMPCINAISQNRINPFI